MKKIVLLAFVVFSAYQVNAQAQRYLNFGGLGTGLYVGYEIPVATPVSIVPQASTNYNFDNFHLGLKGNFYFDDLFEMSSPWDFYAGLGLGWRVDNNNNGNGGFSFGGQIGGRWFWNEKWGLNAEFGWGGAALGGLGLTVKM